MAAATQASRQLCRAATPSCLPQAPEAAHQGTAVNVERVSLPAFANEPILELRRASVRAGLDDAMARVDAQLPLRVPVMVGGDERFERQLVSTDPGEPERVVADSAQATESDVDAAVATARGGALEWASRTAEERAQALIAAAAWMRERRLELAALEVRECAKPWPEADADVCEAIDFLEYYARGAIELAAAPRAAPGPWRAQRAALRPARRRRRRSRHGTSRLRFPAG